MVKVIEKVNELMNLESHYGWVSCFDAPAAYDEMENLRDEISLKLNKKHMDVVEHILYDYGYENIEDIIITEFDEYVEEYLCMNDDSKEIFNSLYYWMSEVDRRKWFEINYLSDNNHVYLDKHSEYIFEVILK